MKRFISRLLGSASPQDGLQLCPLPSALSLADAKRVMVFCPHPDDETLGCGGTLARLSGSSDIRAALVTDGGGAGFLDSDAVARRYGEMQDALTRLGVADCISFGEEDGNFGDSPAFRKKAREALTRFSPNWVFLPSPFDLHRDHVRVSRVLREVCRSIAGIEKIIYYEVWSPLPATHVVDISSVIEQKRTALACHKTPLSQRNFLDAGIGLNAFRSLYLSPSPEATHAECFLVEADDSSSRLVDTLMQMTDVYHRALTSGG